MSIVEIIAAILLAGGAFFSIIGGIGIVRLPDFFSRLHGGGITDTLGAGLVLLGLLVMSDNFLTASKLICILAFLAVTSPTSCHALAKSALLRGVNPQLDGVLTDSDSDNANGAQMKGTD